jgi:adenosylhomocysteine nucleosidase
VRLSTGGAVITGAAYDAIDADMVDMETFAVARACMAHGVPLAGLRGVSDGAEDLRQMDDWKAYLHVIDEKLAGVVDRILALAD